MEVSEMNVDLTQVSGRGTDRGTEVIDGQTPDPRDAPNSRGDSSVAEATGLVSGDTQINMSRNETARPSRRVSRVFTGREKLLAIARVRYGETKAAVGRDIGVPESTLRGWCKSEEKIKRQVENLDNLLLMARPSGTSTSIAASGLNLPVAATQRWQDSGNEDPERKRLGIENIPAIPMTVDGINEQLLSTCHPQDNFTGLIQSGLQYTGSSGIPSSSGKNRKHGISTINLPQDVSRNKSKRQKRQNLPLATEKSSNSEATSTPSTSGLINGPQTDPSTSKTGTTPTDETNSTNEMYVWRQYMHLVQQHQPQQQQQLDLLWILNCGQIFINKVEQHQTAVCTMAELSQIKKIFANMKEHALKTKGTEEPNPSNEDS